MAAKTPTTFLNKSSFLFLFAGAAIMFLFHNFVKPEGAYIKGAAKAEYVNGLYVFIESNPDCENCYEIIGEVKGEGLIDRTRKLGIGEEKAGKVLENLFAQGRERLNLKENINVLTQEVKKQYTDADGVIMNDRLNQCVVIKYVK